MNESPPLVSVIVPTRNSARTLSACLESVRSQEYESTEIIVVDNSSTDETVQIAKRHTSMVESCGPERSAQRNRGAQVSHGDYLLFADSDMTLAPRVVSDCVEAIRLSGAPAVIIPEVSIGEGFLAKCRALERSCYVGDDTVEAARFFTRGAFEASGGYDQNLTGPEDWDLSIRIADGNRLPRSASLIYHHEGRLRLGTIFAKKRHYAPSSLVYLRKHRRSAASQANLVFRPALLRNWRRLSSHPLLSGGILALKTLETVAILSGLLEGWLAGRAAGEPSC